MYKYVLSFLYIYTLSTDTGCPGGSQPPMGRRGRDKKRAARERRAAARRAAEEELRAAVEREGDERRQAAHIVAKDFVKLFMPRAERMGAFCVCVLLKSREMRKAARKAKTTVMYEALEAMQYSCHDCLVGEEWGQWHCVCKEGRWDYGEMEEEEEQEQSEQLTEEEEEDVTSDDGSEWEDGFETDTEEDEEQQNDEMMISPEIALPSAKMITPEDAATRTWGGKVLFRK